MTSLRVGACLTLAVSVGLLAGPGVSGGASAATPRWRVVPTAGGAAFGQLAAVSCSAPTSCVAVGAQDASGKFDVNPLIERWNGSKWVAQRSPVPTGARESMLSAVTCSSSAFCVAVGQYSTSAATKTLALRWTNGRWTIMPTPNPSLGVRVLSGVACTSTSNCFAVGTASGGNAFRVTLVERWDGAHWSIVPSPNVAHASNNALDAVSCAGSNDCAAVGAAITESGDNSVTNTLAEHWNGASWALVASPNPPKSTDNEMWGVACPSPADCIAVGPSNAGTLAERWNGAHWSIIASKNPGGRPEAGLASVSCPAATRCTAVGFAAKKAIIEVFTPTGASVGVAPVPSGTILSHLSGISCANTTNCSAVGEYRRGPSRRPLLLHYS